ncbi:hypothetical protein [Cohaesibacter haloalkalitolerans]|uniref:hypothetical protein n=1 Tax=Cohaesibacter haloalkalitolerans TaxID=1162980 RepID=UPI000E654A0B|nr:hypothetical protein [Cohaesibacter haloalkalitolerans]
MSRFKKAQTDALFTIESRTLNPAAPVVELPANSLVWEHWTDRNELKQVDLTMFHDGSDQMEIIGRPRLIFELAPIFRADTHGRSLGTLATKVGYIVKFFRFLTELQQVQGRNIISCHDLTSADGHGYKRFLLDGLGEHLKSKSKCLSYIRICVDKVRKEKGEAALRWPKIEVPKEVKEHRDVEPRALKAVYNAAKRVHDNSWKQHERGEKALLRGTDPRIFGQTGHRGGTRGSKGGQRNIVWYRWRNILVLLRERIRHRVAFENDISRSDIVRINNALHKIETWASKNGWKDRGWPVPSIDALYRMIAPSVNDTMAAYSLVSFHTGWLDTARAITVVDGTFEESDDWFSDRTGQETKGQDRRGSMMILVAVEESEEGKEDTVDIGAIRPKTKRMHSALSLKSSRYQPYAVIKTQIDRTRFLRELLRDVRLRLLSEAQTSEIRAEIALIERKLRSPWIYFNPKGKGQECIGLLGETIAVSIPFNKALKPLAIEWAERRGNNVDTLSQAIKLLRPSDIRDGYAAFVYDASGSDIFAVQNILNHKSIASTRHYLRQKRQIKELFKKHRVLAGAILRETQDGHSIDPTILRIEMTTGGITEGDRQALEVYRIGKGFRGRFGMGCKAPFNPPASIVHNHLAGTICPAQRCLLCQQAIFLPDALDPLANRYAELRELSRTIPPQEFDTSSLLVELKGIEMVREALRDDILAHDFDAIVEAHTKALLSGDAYIFEDIQLSSIKQMGEQDLNQ